MAKAHLEEVNGTIMIALPATIVDQHRLAAGSEVDVEFDNDTLLVRSRTRKRFTLDELIARCDTAAFERTAEDEEWLNSPPVGRELI